jgi:hypothetical protein
MLPSIIEQRYASAKAAFDQKDYAVAEAGFKEVLSVLSDPDVGQAAGQPPLSDLQTLAAGFHELSAAAAVPPPLPAAPAAPVSTAALTASAPPAQVELPLPRVYSLDDPGVVAPVALRQSLPAFQFASAPRGLPQGMLELVIDERGYVESARMRQPIYPLYDSQVLDAARGFQYKPATLNGVPVRYRKLVGITVKR